MQNRMLLSSAAIFLAAVGLCRAVAAPSAARPTVDTPLPTPGMGWSTFNFFLARHDDKLLRQMGDAFVASGLRDAGYTIMRIDGGWWGNDSDRRWWYWTEAGRYEGGQACLPGDPHVDPKNYPHGIGPLADYLHGKGLKLGFYLAPEISTGIADNYPQNNRDHKVPPPVTGMSLVDQHAHWVAENRIDHLFFDGYDWGEAKGSAPYLRMFQDLRKEAARMNRPIIFSINSGWKARPCQWADEWRTSPDINGEWRSIMENLATVADPKSACTGRWNNPDYLMTGFTGDQEAKSQMSLWCVAAAPLYLSYDFRVMNDWERYVVLNTEAIAVDQDPDGKPGRRLRAEADTQIWARPLADGSRAVVLLNTSSALKSIALRWSDLGMQNSTAVVRDLWAHRTLGQYAGGYTAADVPPHGCAFLRVRFAAGPVQDPPQTWAPEPRRPKKVIPISPQAWTIRTTFPRKDDPLSNVLDGDPKTEFWSYASAGQYLEIDFGNLLTFDRIVIDHRGTGPNPWPYHVYAPRSTFMVQQSTDGTEFTPLAEGTFGPACTIISVDPVRARSVRIVMKDVERTSAYDEPTFHAKDLYLFNSTPTP